MAKKHSKALQPASSPTKTAADNIKDKLDAAIKALENVENAKDAVDLLKALRKTSDNKWSAEKLRLHEEEFWPYAAKLYENGRWLHPPEDDANPYDVQKPMPPGKTFVGIVLEKTLEVSVVEDLPDGMNGLATRYAANQEHTRSPFDSAGQKESTNCRRYHRPMAVLRKGDIFGTFEAVDMLCHALPLQNYTVYAGIRTFFFNNHSFDAHSDAKKDTKKALTQKKIISKQADWQRKAVTEWCAAPNKQGLSPTQTPLRLLKGLLGTRANEWKCRVLLIEVGSRFVEEAPDLVKRVLAQVAWRQSASLRRQAIQAYSSDRVAVALKNTTKYPKEDRPAIARELNGLLDVVSDGRPGFHEFCADQDATSDPNKVDVEDLGPFRRFFADVHSISPALATDRKIYAVSRRFDSTSSFIQPLWLNVYPEAKNAATESGNRGTGLMTQIKDAWPKITETLFPDDRAYLRSLVKCVGPNVKTGSVPNPVFQRGCIKISSEAPSLPIFSAVSPTSTTAVALVGIQHLMEETICLVQELINRKIVSANRIWLLGKPYSSNPRIIHRLRLMGVTVKSPLAKWELGKFDRWFESEAKEFLAEAVAQLTNHSVAGHVVLLDDGGALLKSSAEISTNASLQFVGVEQTSRGVPAAREAKFPVVLVSSCALKAIVEPEFVARAAVHKIAHYYPEALSAKTIGVVGCFGNVGNYLAQYLAARSDVHSHNDTRILCYDTRTRMENSITSAPGIQDRDFKLEIVTDVMDLFNQAEVVYGCTGLDLEKQAKKSTKRSQLLISLSSGDIEFATALKEKKNESSCKIRESEDMKFWMWMPISLKDDRVVAHGGFPVTFDGAPSSAPLIEMQLTRALLLAGIQQAVSLSGNSPAGPQSLNAESQWKIWERWEEIALQKERRGSVSADPSGIAWREQRESELGTNKLGEWLLDVAKRVGARESFSQKNNARFLAAMGVPAS